MVQGGNKKKPAAGCGGPLLTGFPSPGAALKAGTAAGARSTHALESVRWRSGQGRRSPVRCGTTCPDPALVLVCLMGRWPRRGPASPASPIFPPGARSPHASAAGRHRVVNHGLAALTDAIVGFGPAAVLEREIL